MLLKKRRGIAVILIYLPISIICPPSSLIISGLDAKSAVIGSHPDSVAKNPDSLISLPAINLLPRRPVPLTITSPSSSNSGSLPIHLATSFLEKLKGPFVPITPPTSLSFTDKEKQKFES